MAEARSLIDIDYLKEHYLEVYLEDAVAQLLTNRQEGNKSTTMRPCKFFKEYFTSVHQGTHILFREFSCVSATPYNRLCVLKAIMQIYKPLFYREERYNARDYHSILQLVWPDFRVQVVQDAFTAYDDDKKDEENCLKFLDFVKAMKASFCTGDFDFEANIIENQITHRIAQFSNISAQSGDTPLNLGEADFLVNVEDDAFDKDWSFASKILDGSEFRRILNLNDSNSISSDEPVSGGKLSRSSSESREVSKSEKKGKTKKKDGTKEKTRGRLAGKHLSNSLNLLQSGKVDDSKKSKRRHRSKSAAAVQRTAEKGTQRTQKKPPWRIDGVDDQDPGIFPQPLSCKIEKFVDDI